MNLDLLIKLVKLANNNPNDNEANLAARKVCKMIAEANYKFGSNPISPVSDRAKTTGFGTPYGPSPFDEFFKNNPDFGTWGKEYTENFYNPYAKKKQPKEPKKTSRIRKCVKCGLEVDTYNNREPFNCFACQYTEHNKSI